MRIVLFSSTYSEYGACLLFLLPNPIRDIILIITGIYWCSGCPWYIVRDEIVSTPYQLLLGRCIPLIITTRAKSKQKLKLELTLEFVPWLSRASIEKVF